jgi:hypothetical protein
MTDKLDLSLPKHQPAKTASVSRAGFFLNLIILAGVCAVLAVLLFQNNQGASVKERTNKAGLSSKGQKQLALKLEKQGLNTVAASMWEEYLLFSELNNDETAKIWFRVGKLYQDAQIYDQALAAYYRSERISKIPEISTDISRRVSECLESMGKFAALRDELSERVGMPQTVAGSGQSDASSSNRQAVVAEIGSQKITVSDIDHQIEKAIDRQLSRMASYMSEDVLNQQKEALFKQFSGADQRRQFLNQYLAQEILYREARTSDFINDPKVRSEIKDQERLFLAGKQIEKAYADNINITPADLKTYYEANKNSYVEADLQRPFEDVQNEVYSALRASKEQEVREALLNQLKNKYDVVIHTSVLSAKQDVPDNNNSSIKSTALKAKAQ